MYMINFNIQVNDLYENKNLYMIVDNIYNIGGMVSWNTGLHMILATITATIRLSHP